MLKPLHFLVFLFLHARIRSSALAFTPSVASWRTSGMKQNGWSSRGKSRSFSQKLPKVFFASNEKLSDSTPSSSSSKSSDIRDTKDIDIDWESAGNQLLNEAKEVAACAGIVFSSLFQPPKEKVSAEDIVKLCDAIEETAKSSEDSLFVTRVLNLRRRALEFQRYELLVSLMKTDYDAYVATASFLSPSRIARMQLPNIQDVPYNDPKISFATAKPVLDEEGQPLVADCDLKDKEFNDSPLDKLLLKIFRGLVEKNTGGIKSDKPGIDGLLEQGRTFMLQEGQTPEAQHKMVYDTLGGLMTPVLPPFYRIFMSGIVPKLGTELDGKQFGPWFYAPFLTSFVTPTFFAFLVGPSYPNRRKDGQPGGLVVEKCKFLQESGCKGLCLHQCKLPAQQFFKEELGLPLTVSPNFVTQECQWSFGEEPLSPSDDPSFPKGCLVGCASRKAMAGRMADICN